MKVLATRRFPGPALDELRDLEIVPLTRLEIERPDVEALIVANEPVPFELLPSLRLVADFSVGYDRIDVEACRERGIAVVNTPGVLDAATAELALALMLATRRRLVEGDRLIRSGAWTRPWADGFLGAELAGATLGIVGLGRIGSAVARRARAFDARIVFTGRGSRASELGEYRTLDALLQEADVVSIHVPLSQDTEGLIGARELALLREGACLVNTSRGEIVDEPALVQELVDGRISAGLDVYAHEPRVPQELLGLDNVVLAPHIGSATGRTRAAMTRVVVDNILAFERGEPLLTLVSG